MNKNRFRIIFNQLRGLMMVVAENVKSHTGRAESGKASTTEFLSPSFTKDTIVGMRPIAFSLMCVLGLVTIVPNPINIEEVHAEARAATNVPGNHRPTVLLAPNGVEVVNIQTPSAAGVSHNVYNILNVPEQGMIFNNSRTNVQTELGGWIQGNPWLATGSARIILNEINSSNPSYLNGYMEVAGTRAELIIANPNGISCNGCGFINASRGVLTTGIPQLSGGDLTGYRVTSGTVNIWGNGLDASRSNYTDIIARAVEVNAGIWANDLKITTGANTVNAANTQTSTIAASGAAPASGIALDVAALGGMYAGKITLIGTEAGLGVRNAGTISASGGNLALTADGRLENTNTIIGSGNITIATTDSIGNTGTVYAQGNTSLTTQADINNSGLIAAQGNTDLVANGANSRISNTANAVLAAGLKTDGTLTTSGNLNISATQSVTALGQNLSAGDQSLTAKQLDISGSNTFAGNLTLVASNGDIQAQNATISANQALTASTTQSLITDGATVSANQLNLTAHTLSNIGGTLIQTGSGDTSINLVGDLNNSQGRIATNSNHLTLAAQILTNTSGSIEHAGSGTLAITATTFNGAAGQIISNGALNLTASTTDLNHGSTIAKQINIDTATLNNQSGEIIQTGTAASSITATTKLDNSGGIIGSNGNTALTVGDLDNRGGTVQAAGTASLTINATGNVDNSMINGVAASMQAGGALTLNAATVNNTQSEITAGDTLTIITTSNSIGLQNTQGLIASNQALTLNTASLNNSDGTVASVHDDVTITANVGSINNSAGQISAAQNLSTNSHGLNNTAGILSANSVNIDTQLQALDNNNGNITASTDLDLQTGALTNDAGLIQSGGNLTVNTHSQTLTNSNSGTSKGILALGSSTFTTGDLNNQTGYIGARGAITANSAVINNNTGSMMSEAAVTLNGSSLDNQSGSIEALGNVDINATSNIDNRTGLLRSGQTLNLTTTTLDNRNTQNTNNGIEGAAAHILADNVDNTSGSMLADNSLLVTGTNAFNNTQGKVSSGATLHIKDKLAVAGSNVNTKTLAVTNTSGTIIAGTALNIDTQSLTGDGKVLSQGDLATKLTSDFTHSGEWQADGNATLTTTGNLTNQAKLLAGGNLDITAANLDNQAAGEIAGANLNIAVADTLTNRGLLDGGDTFINTTALNNIGTGRIYGDHIAIAATTLNNVEETVNGITTAAVIAARDRLDIGAQTISNRNDALIFSAGDMAIGGSLDQNHQATVAAGEPQVTSLINSGATIEALGNLQLSVADLQNLNPALVTQEVQIATGSFHMFTPRGRSEVLNANDFPLWQIGNFNMSWRYGSTYNMPFNFREYYRYIGTTATTETQVVSSNPGQILSGGNLNISGNVTNSDSQIIAGGLLDVTAAAVQNVNSEGSTVKRYTGSAYYYDYDGNESCGDPGDGCYDISYLGAYNPANEVQTFSLNISKLAQLSPVSGSGTQVAALTTGSITQTATGANNVNVAVVTGSNQGGNTQVATVITNTQIGADTVVRTTNPNTAVPNNSLFHTSPNPTGSYYVETDPRFANYKNWLSSDYMLKALRYDPTMVTKRLGDGFYEQRLIREQIAQLTGRRFLAGYASDEQQYQALMTNGATFAKAHQLIPGVALTEAQIAQLTADIVWLVEKTITLADGTTVQALVPQVYVRLQPGDINDQGTLLAGDSINLKLSGDLTNSGSIAGRTVVSITADNINNLGGRISGNNTQLNAHNDINNIGGSIQGNDSLSLNAGHDINIASTTQSNRNTAGASSFIRTNIDRIAGLYVGVKVDAEQWALDGHALYGYTNPNGILVASSGNNINLQGAMISNSGGSNSGTNGITVLDAGNNLNLTTITTAEQNNTIKNSKNYIKHGNTQEIGTVIQTEGDLILNAGNNVSARAANVTSEQGNLTVNAANDINIEAGEATSNLAAARTTKKSGTFSSKKTTSRDSFNDTEVISSTFSGDSVDMQAGNNLTVTGSNVVGTNNVNLNAGNNVTLDTAQATHDETHYSKTKKSGFTASSTSIGYGTSKLTTTNDTQQVINVGSTVGSVQGNVNINAGKAYTQTGSDVLTPQGDINISAQSVDINAATDTYANQQSMKYKQSGITVGVSSSALNLAQNVLGTTGAAVTSDSTRNKALNALQTYANGATLYEQGKGVVNAAKAGNVQDAAGAAGVRLSVSIGSTKAESSSTTNITAQQESLVKAGGNVNITATQDDLTIKGSQITADKNLTLDAAKNINLIASTDTESNQGKNKSSSTSIGVSVGVGAGGAGLSVDLAASRGKGSANSDSTTYNNTHVTAGETLTLKSGQDTNMTGANAAGKKVIANVGENLNIQSLQDTATSKAKQSNTGISISVPIASPTLGNTFGAVSQSKQNSNSNYASVYEQSGIQAGEQGFNITTQGNTDLKGAVIESIAPAEKNQLTTGTLTVSNIQNHMDAEVGSSGTTLNTKMLNSKYKATKAIAANLQNHGEADISDNSTTRSAVSPATFTIADEAQQQQLTGNTAEETVAALNRDTTNTNRVLAKPDMQALQEKAQQEQADRMLAITAITAFTDEAYRSRLQATPKVFKVECPAESNCQDNPKLLVRTEIDPKEIANVPAGSIVAVNGILNDEKRGAELAYQNTELITDPVTGKKDKPTTVYLMHIAPATNAVSELLGVAYEKFTASSDYGLANFLGYTNGQELYADLLRSRGQQATESLGHSRGTLAQEAAFTILGNRPDENGNTYTNPNLTVRGVGGAADAVAYTDKAAAVQGSSGDKDKISYNYFSNDPVATSSVSGGNIGTWTLKDLWQVFSTDNSMHSCYGTGAAGCTQVEIPVPGGPQGTTDGNAKLIQYQGGVRVNNYSTVQ